MPCAKNFSPIFLDFSKIKVSYIFSKINFSFYKIKSLSRGTIKVRKCGVLATGIHQVKNTDTHQGVGSISQKSMPEKFFPIFFWKINFLATYQDSIFGFLRRGNKKISGRFVPFRDSICF
nr:MAG TPA: hypothetical protein [Bacteriophage sp.]